MKITLREGILLAALLLVTTGTAYYLYFWQPLSAKQAVLSIDLLSLEAVIARLAPWEGKEADLRREIEELRGRIALAAEANAIGIPLPDSLVMAEEVARAANLTIESTAIRQTETGGLLELEIAGLYSSVYRFLSRLEEEDAALVLDGFSFTSQNNFLQGQVQVRLFSGEIVGEAKDGGVPTRSPFAPR